MFVILVSVLAVGSLSVFIGYTLANHSGPKIRVDQPKAVTEDLIVFTNGTTGAEFISQYHKFYNDTVCYGRIEYVDIKEQKKAANEILKKINSGVTIDPQYKEAFDIDLGTIKYNATKVVEEGNTDRVVDLHRLFHDLDIYYNGYSASMAWEVTEFLGE